MAETESTRSQLPAPRRRIDWRRQLGIFLKVGGGSIFYCLSALCVLGGLTAVMSDALSGGQIGQKLTVIASLHGYELALLAVLCLIVLWRHVTDDAVSLVVLMAIFLMTSGLFLSTVVNDSTRWPAPLAALGFIFSAAKLWALRNKIGLPLFGAAWVSALWMMAWNFCTPAVMAAVIRGSQPVDEAAMWMTWRVGYGLLVMGALGMAVHAVRLGVGGARTSDVDCPFLRTAGMVWVFGAITYGAAIGHLYALTYVFRIPFAWGDLALALMVVGPIGLEILRAYGVRQRWADWWVVAPGVVMAIVATVGGAFSAQLNLILDVGMYPPVLLGVYGVYLALLAVRRRAGHLGEMAALCGVAAVALYGCMPGLGLTQQPIHWVGAGLCITALLWLKATVRHDASIGLLAVVTGVATVGRHWIEQGVPEGMEFWPLLIYLFMVGVVVLHVQFGPRLWFSNLEVSAVVLALASMAAFGGSDVHSWTPWTSAPTALLAVLIVWRTGYRASGGILLVPMAWDLHVLSGPITGWHGVVLGVILLGVGARVSLKKGQRRMSKKAGP
jgi:hypothetical protein